MLPYVNHLAGLMGLEGWEFTISDEPAGKEEYANISVVYGQKRAIISLARDHASWTPECVRSTIVHELMHCHFEPVLQLSHDIIESLGVAKSTSVADAALNFLVEQTVDAISTAYARTLPLPWNEDL